MWSWVFSKNHMHRYPSSAGGTNFVDFFFLFVPWQAQIHHSLCRSLNAEGKASRIACICSDLCFDPAFVTVCVLQVFLQARLYLNKKQKTRFMGWFGCIQKLELFHQEKKAHLQFRKAIRKEKEIRHKQWLTEFLLKG